MGDLLDWHTLYGTDSPTVVVSLDASQYDAGGLKDSGELLAFCLHWKCGEVGFNTSKGVL